MRRVTEFLTRRRTVAMQGQGPTEPEFPLRRDSWFGAEPVDQLLFPDVLGGFRDVYMARRSLGRSRQRQGTRPARQVSVANEKGQDPVGP